MSTFCIFRNIKKVIFTSLHSFSLPFNLSTYICLWCGVVVATEMDEEDKKRTTEIEEREIEREREGVGGRERKGKRKLYVCQYRGGNKGEDIGERETMRKRENDREAMN